MKRWLPPVWITLIFALLVLAYCTRTDLIFSDPDTGWHIAAGDLMRAVGAVRINEPWSFSAPGYRWLDISWAWDVLESWVYQHAGLQGIVALTAVLMAAVAAGVAWQCLARGVGALTLFFSVLMLMVTQVLSARPHTVTFLFIVAAAGLMRHVRAHPERRWKLALLLPMTVLWVNVHGGFLALITLLGAYGVDAIFRRAWRELAAYVAAGAGCLLAALANPFGIGIVEGVARTLFSKACSFIVEWQPLQFDFAALTYTFPIPLFLMLVRPRDPRFSTAEKLLAFFWLLMAVDQRRYLFVFMLLAAPMLAEAIEPYLAPRGNAQGWAPALRVWGAVRRAVNLTSARAGVLVLALALALFCAMPAAGRVFNDTPLRLPPDLDGSIAFIVKHYPHVRFLNTYEFGGPIIFRTRGALPVFIDGRAETAYPKQVIEDYMAFRNNASDWEARMSRYGVGGLFLRRGALPDNAALADHCGWKLVYADSEAKVYVKAGIAEEGSLSQRLREVGGQVRHILDAH